MAGDGPGHQGRTQRARLPPEIDVEAMVVARMVAVHDEDPARSFSTKSIVLLENPDSQAYPPSLLAGGNEG